MISAKKINREQAFHAIKNGEFAPSVIASAARVAVVMTQDWCPQWTSMKRWLYDLEPDLELYELVYNLEDFFHEFRTFKETSWENGHIPYVRYYIDGSLKAVSNYVSREDFLKNLSL